MGLPPRAHCSHPGNMAFRRTFFVMWPKLLKDGRLAVGQMVVGETGNRPGMLFLGRCAQGVVVEDGPLLKLLYTFPLEREAPNQKAIKSSLLFFFFPQLCNRIGILRSQDREQMPAGYIATLTVRQ